MVNFVCHGDILYSESIEKLKVFEDSYLVVQDGFVEGIYETLPEKFQGVEVKDYGRGLIIPAFSDLHIHASQFVQRGVGMDKLLFDWLNDYTFPQEARFASMDYAKNVYDQVVTELLRQGTFHASLFTTIHYDASDYLFRALADKGMYAYVGKVNMDMNSPEYLCETTEESLKETERFLAEHQGKGTVQPILTPRFAPTCSEPLMKGLGELAAKYHCGLQTHLVESQAEVKWTLELFPDYGSDAEIYERNGLLEHGPSIFAHYIFPSQADLDIIRKAGSVTVHCPDATTNIIAGIIYVGLAFVLSELFSKRLLKIKIENLGMPKFSIKAKWIIVGVLLPVTVKAVYLFFFSGKYVSSGMNSNQIFSILSAGIAFTGIAAGFVEEMVFRGVILNLLKEKWNIKVAVLIPSVLFGLVHIIGMDFSIISSLLVLIAGTMVGIMFSMVAIESGSVWNGGIVHSLWNILIIGGGLSISEKADEYSVMTYVLDSKDFVFTGGEFGIESSIIALLGYVIVTLAAICMIKKKRVCGTFSVK